jgi:hypothetical protein
VLSGRPFRHELFHKCEQMFLHNQLSDLLDLHGALFRDSRALAGHGDLHVGGFQGGQILICGRSPVAAFMLPW